MPQYLDSIVVEGGSSLQTIVSPAPSTATTLNGTLTLTAASATAQLLTGTQTGFSVVLPVATTLPQGQKFEIYNTSSQNVLIKANGGATILTLAQTSSTYLYLQDNSTAAGTWLAWQTIIGSASGVLNYNIVSSTAFVTSVRTPTYAAITGMTATPVAGTYAIWYNASVFYTTTPKAHFWRLTKAGTSIADSARQQDTAHSNQTMVDSTMTVATFNGSQACAVEVACDNTGTLTVNSRSLLLIRLGT